MKVRVGVMAAALAALRAGKRADEVGDHTPLRAEYADAPRDQIRVLFGDAMAEALFSVAPGDWTVTVEGTTTTGDLEPLTSTFVVADGVTVTTQPNADLGPTTTVATNSVPADPGTTTTVAG